MEQEQFEKWLASSEPALVNAVVSDARRNIHEIQSSGHTIFGYAILPPDYFTASEPSTICVAYNSDPSLHAIENNGGRHGYFVNEWQNQARTGFDSSNSELAKILKTFRDNYSKPQPEIVFDANGQVLPECLAQFVADQTEIRYVAKINKAILLAMTELKGSGVFKSDPFLDVFIFESDCEIVKTSAKLLNSPEHYESYCRAMGR
jgi:hypothetical protein